jgi:hypothetical protein
MGYFQAFSACFVCHRLFYYHPLRVPSIAINGVREPICQHCVDRVNPRRIANGLPPIVPLPGAYDAADESEWPAEEEA